MITHFNGLRKNNSPIGVNAPFEIARKFNPKAINPVNARAVVI